MLRWMCGAMKKDRTCRIGKEHYRDKVDLMTNGNGHAEKEKDRRETEISWKDKKHVVSRVEDLLDRASEVETVSIHLNLLYRQHKQVQLLVIIMVVIAEGGHRQGACHLHSLTSPFGDGININVIIRDTRDTLCNLQY